jgi:lactate dehydrogenase-like 2-hydroxyacid dehydrogenase
VFSEKPPTDKEFLSLPNLMVTPHIGGNALEAVDAMGSFLPSITWSPFSSKTSTLHVASTFVYESTQS